MSWQLYVCIYLSCYSCFLIFKSISISRMHMGRLANHIFYFVRRLFPGLYVLRLISSYRYYCLFCSWILLFKPQPTTNPNSLINCLQTLYCRSFIVFIRGSNYSHVIHHLQTLKYSPVFQHS